MRERSSLLLYARPATCSSHHGLFLHASHTFHDLACSLTQSFFWNNDKDEALLQLHDSIVLIARRAPFTAQTAGLCASTLCCGTSNFGPCVNPLGVLPLSEARMAGDLL